jgi:cell wall assembly regulator SMI1
VFDKTNLSVSREEIDVIESELGIIFPPSLLKHYFVYNGGVPSKPYFYSAESDIEIEIQRFSPIKHLNEGIRINTMESKYKLFKQKSVLMTDYLPFANDFGSNQICINLVNGKIYMVYMDMGDLAEKCFVFLADDFEAFLLGLSSESVDAEE